MKFHHVLQRPSNPSFCSILDTKTISQKWVYSNLTLSPLSNPTMCLQANATTASLALCAAATNTWSTIYSVNSYLMLQQTGTEQCISVLVPT